MERRQSRAWITSRDRLDETVALCTTWNWERLKKENGTFNDDDDTLCLWWWWSPPSLAAHWWRWTWERQMCSCSRQSPRDVETFIFWMKSNRASLVLIWKTTESSVWVDRERQVWREWVFFSSIKSFFQSVYGDNAGDNLVNFQDLTSMVMMFNPNPALIMSTVFSLPVPNTDIKQ